MSWRRTHGWMLAVGASACASSVTGTVGDAAGDEPVAVVVDTPTATMDVPVLDVGRVDAGADVPMVDIGIDAASDTAMDAGVAGPSGVQLTFGERTILGAALAVGDADYGVLWTERDDARTVRVGFMRVGFDGARGEPTALDEWPAAMGQAVELGGMARSLAAQGGGYVMAWVRPGELRVARTPLAGGPAPAVLTWPVTEATRLFVDDVAGAAHLWSCAASGGCLYGTVAAGDAGMGLTAFVPRTPGVIVAARRLSELHSTLLQLDPTTNEVRSILLGSTGMDSDYVLPPAEGIFAAGEAFPQMRVLSRGDGRQHHPYVVNAFAGAPVSTTASAPPDTDAWNSLAAHVVTSTSGPPSFAVGWFTFLGRGGYNGVPYLMTGSISMPPRNARACPMVAPGFIPEVNLTVIRPAWNPRRARWAVLWQDARERPSHADAATHPRTQLFLREVADADCPTYNATPIP